LKARSSTKGGDVAVQALSLPPAERAALARHLVESLGEAAEGPDRALWTEAARAIERAAAAPPPAPRAPAASSAAPASARDTLQRVFGFDAFRPGQEGVIERLLAGRSTLAVFPTGGGKSLCYQLPALLLDGLTLVVSPLIALMKDQVDALARRGVAAARLDSSLTREETNAVLDRVASGALKLLYVAPERLSNERFLSRVRKLRISLLAVDEAHCISEWGHNFRPEYLKVARTAEALGVGAVLALTATATPAVAVDIRRAFKIDPKDHIQTDLFRENLALHVTPCPTAALDRVPLLVERLAAQPGPSIVYVTLQRTAEEVAEALRRVKVNAQAYHAGLEAPERDAVQDAFMSGSTRVVVATIAFGMGIDKADIRAIYHLNLPKTLEGYVQEVGRAGRDGLPARCELFACADDRIGLENFTYGDTPTPEAVRALVTEVLAPGREGQDPTFSVSVYDLSQTHDIRPLVVETALTYLELEGALRATGPFYAGYQLRFLKDQDQALARFDAARQAFLGAVLRAGKQGRTWLTLDLAEVAAATEQPRERIEAALRYLDEQGDIELKPSGLRQGFERTRSNAALDPVVTRLLELFRRREERDIERTAQVLRFVEDRGCLVLHLLSHFGEAGRAPCTRCTSCKDASPAHGPRPVPRSPAPPLDDRAAALVGSLRSEGHEALRHPRQLARYLCGLSSPATARARLGRDPRSGRLGHVPFADVLAFVERLEREGALPPA
jgi:ATP-dependent DNA helicase RecQ